MDYSSLLANVRHHNSQILVEDAGAYYKVSTYPPKMGLITCVVNKGTEDATALESIQPYWNIPTATEEFRFITHKFNNPASWDGRTNGDPAASWAADNGGVFYDDVHYKWLDVNGDPVCHLDTMDGGVGSIWRDEEDEIIVQYNAVTSHWERVDNSANVTSSRWSIVPYPNTKMALIQAKSLFHYQATIQPVAEGVPGALRYIVYMYLPEGYAGPGAPAGIYPVKQFVYQQTELLALAANQDDKDESTGMVSSLYDYRITSIVHIDSRMAMRLDIQLDGHLPVLSNYPALASFIGNKIASF